MKEVALAGLDLVELVAVEHLLDEDGAGDDHRRPRPGGGPGAAALSERKTGEPLALDPPASSVSR